MYCFAKICCLCLDCNMDLFKLEDADPHGVTFLEKLMVLIPGFEQLMKQSIPNFVCRKCKRYLNKFFKFQQNCLKSYKLLGSYLKQLDRPTMTPNAGKDPDLPVIEDDLILMKEDMEQCLKNMKIYAKNEDSNPETSDTSDLELTEESNTSSSQGSSPKLDTSSRKRTRECKKISYNEDYDSDTIISDSELYYTKRKRKAKQREDDDVPKKDKTVVIPQNDVFAQDLTRTLNDIITRLAANNVNTSNSEEFKVKFKNSSGNSEQLSIYQDKDTVEVKFTKEQKMGYLKVCRQGESFILTHNMSDSPGVSSPSNKSSAEEVEVAAVPGTSTPEGVVPIQEGSWKCAHCSKNFKTRLSLREHEHQTVLKNIGEDSSTKALTEAAASQRRNTPLGPTSVDLGPGNLDPKDPGNLDPKDPKGLDPKDVGPKDLDPKGVSPEDVSPKDLGPEVLNTKDVGPEDLGPKVQSQPAEEPPGEPPSPRSSRCEIKVVLSEIQESQVKSERSSSPEYQFHLSDDSEDEFDNDTVILGSLDQDNDFSDTRSSSPVELGSEVLEFLEEDDVAPDICTRLPEKAPPLEMVRGAPESPPFKGFPRGSVVTKPNLNIAFGDNQKLSSTWGKIGFEHVRPPEEVPPSREDVGPSRRKGEDIASNDPGRGVNRSNGKVDCLNDKEDCLSDKDCLNGKEEGPEKDVNQKKEKPPTNGVDLNNSLEERRLKIIVSRMEVEEYLTKNKGEETKKKPKERRRSSPRKQTGIAKAVVEKFCPKCKEAFKTLKTLKAHVEKAHQIVTRNHNMDT